MRKLICVLTASSIMFTGCASFHTYTPTKPAAENMSLIFKQGVGTLTAWDDESEIAIYPTYKMNIATAIPTFSIFYFNKSGKTVDFSNANVKVFFRGKQQALYTFEERTAEIRSNKATTQILLAVVGGLAAASAANTASYNTTTYRSNGNIYGRGGVTGWNHNATIRTYDPSAGMLAGAGVIAATGVSINQVERYAAMDEHRAQAILQQNTVMPATDVQGQLMIKNCCDSDITPNDEVRFEITVGQKTTVFTFQRTAVQAN